MKGQDIVVAMMLVGAETSSDRNIPSISALIAASTSVVHDSLGRLLQAKLIRPRTHEPVTGNLLEFLEHGLRFVFPAEIGRVTRGMPTASSAPPLDAVFGHGETENEFVWPSATGETRGASLVPLYPGVLHASQIDSRLHELLALTDGLRVDDPRVRQEAASHIRARLEGKR